MVKLKARQMKSVADARKSSKSPTGTFIKFISEDGIMARLLDEPDGWVAFAEHYDEGGDLGYFPCVEGDCPGCDAGGKATQRYLVPIIDVEEDEAVVLKVPKSLAQELVSKYDRRGTLLDRDYFFFKEGSGKNGTRYKVDDEDKKRRNVDKFEIPDLMAALQSAWDRAFDNGDDEEDDEEETKPRRSAKKAGAKKAAPRKAGGRTRRSNDDEDDEDDEDEAPRRSVGKRAAKKAPARKAVAKKTGARRTTTRRSR